MKIRTIICLISFTFLTTAACKKSKEEVSPSKTYSYNRDVVGNYEGQIREKISDAGINGNNFIDTTYNDNIEVSLINQDSLKFIRGYQQFTFKLDTIDFYMKWLGPNTIISFKFLDHKELQYSFETRNWIGDSLHSQAIIFKGYKK
jgi:hypothetical protein